MYKRSLNWEKEEKGERMNRNEKRTVDFMVKDLDWSNNVAILSN